MNSDFIIETVNGDTGEYNQKTFEWTNSKKSLNKPFNPYKTRAFFGLDLSVGVVSADISTSGKDTLTHKPQGASAQVVPGSLAKEQQQLSLSEIPFLNIESIPRVGGVTPDVLYFNFPTASHKEGYEKVVKAIGQGWIKSYITQIKTALEQSVINGAPATHQYLSNIIGKDAGADVTAMDQNLVNSFNGVENFLKYFVETMVRRVRKSGNEKGLMDVADSKGKDIIKNKLKELVGKVEPTPKKVVKNAAPAKNTPVKKKARTLQEAIREIISQNLKHF